MASHCRDEHFDDDDHDHGHGGHGHGGHDHDGHDHDDANTPALQSLLYEQIDFSKTICYNEQVSGSGVAVLKKSWRQRMDAEPEIVSDADEQLLINIP